MKNLKIFCEGVTDQIFIADCLELLYDIQSYREVNKNNRSKIQITYGDCCEIIDVGGCSKLANEYFIQKMKDNTELGGINVVIFDADFPTEEDQVGTGNKGFNSCCQKLDDIKERCSVKFEYLIWPNHAEDGEIENLLGKLIPDNRKPILDCICNHQNCLKSLSTIKLRVADTKDLIGYYLHTCWQESNVGKRNYKDSSYWNLDFDRIEDLKKFKLFLDSVFAI